MTPRRLIEPARLASTAVLRGQSDERLIDLARAGNERAFEAIVHRYRKPLLRYCARILPPGRAEDAVQQAFLSAHNAIANGDKELKLRPWLYRVAHNSALNLLRQNGWNHDELDDQFDGVLRPDQAFEARERIQALVASVKGLPERQRDALVLRELEGRSYEEIAVALGVTDGAVRQLLNRARSTLRAGATAITPYGLLERITEIGTGAGAGLSLAKVGAAVLVTGAVATGAANHGVPGLGGSSHLDGDQQAQASSGPAPAAAGATGERLAAKDTAPGPKSAGGDGRGHHRGTKHHGRSRHRGEDRSGSNRSGGDATRMVDEHSGSGTSGGGDRSGSGGDGHSGSGSGDTTSGASGEGSSGSGDGMTATSGTSGSSGSGSPDGSSSGGSDGSSASLSSGSGTSGSGSSGSGGGSGTSGSGDGTTTTPTSDGSH